MLRYLPASVFLVFALQSWAAVAQTSDEGAIEKPVATQEEVDAVVLIPSLHNGISYIGGGIGVVERKALEQWAKGYSLRIEMATKSGSYLGDMRVRVFNASGALILDAPSDGPLFFVMLPEGNYAIDVSGLPPSEYAGMKREVKIVDGKQVRAFFAWP
ncbi:MAG TPA: hypothetical protein ENO09_06435 [bacterium]|nr:hypothetical protein [bacterium]